MAASDTDDPVAITAEVAGRAAARLDELAGRVVTLAEINSGSYNPDGVNRCGDVYAEFAAALAPDSIERIEVAPNIVLTDAGTFEPSPVGTALRVAKRPDAPFQVCAFGHLDTVFAPDHPFQTVRREGDTLFGPGVADCKGGLVIALEVLAELDRHDWGEQIGWELIAVPDEEIGSNGSKPLLAESAHRANLGIGVEPALPSGGIAGARKGSINAHLVVHGKASHVGRAYDEGRSAINELARLIRELETANERSGVTVNCGKIKGGGPLNVVPDLAIGSFNMRVETATDRDWIVEKFAAAVAASDLDIDLQWASERPPKIRTDALNTLLADVSAAAEAAGVVIVAEDTGGCCDGNDLAANGLVNVDSMGIRGGGIHSDAEFAEIGSIPERVAVITETIRRTAARAAADSPTNQE